MFSKKSSLFFTQSGSLNSKKDRITTATLHTTRFIIDGFPAVAVFETSETAT